MLGRAVYDQTTSSWHIERLAGSAGSGIPVGSVIEIAGSIVPPGYLACDGSTFSAASYPNLYAILNSTTLPDYRSLAQTGNTIVIRALTGAQDLDDATITAYIVNLLETSYVPKDLTLQDKQIVIYDAVTNTWKGVDLPVMNNRALVSILTPAHTDTQTVYTADGTTYYTDEFDYPGDLSDWTEGSSTSAGLFTEYNDGLTITWYKKVGGNYYSVTSFTDAGTLVSDASLVITLDGITFDSYQAIEYSKAVAASTSYGWGSSGGNGISYIGTTAGYEVAKLIPDGQEGFIPSDSLVDLTDKTNPLLMAGSTYVRDYYIADINLNRYYHVDQKYNPVEINATGVSAIANTYKYGYYDDMLTVDSSQRLIKVIDKQAGTGQICVKITPWGVETDGITAAIAGYSSSNVGKAVYYRNVYN